MSKAAITVEAFVANELNIREAGGHRVLDVSLPHTPSKKDDQGQWVDAGPTTWYQATFWDEHADVVLRTIEKGSLVTVSGFPEIEVYSRTDGTPGGKVLIKYPTLAVVVRRPKQGASVETPPAGDDVWSQPGSTDDTPF
jgi:single-strand DNA-binding protein